MDKYRHPFWGLTVLSLFLSGCHFIASLRYLARRWTERACRHGDKPRLFVEGQLNSTIQQKGPLHCNAFSFISE